MFETEHLHLAGRWAAKLLLIFLTATFFWGGGFWGMWLAGLILAVTGGPWSSKDKWYRH